jgi:hypothetical protein
VELFSITCLTCHARLKVRNQAAIGQIVACPRCHSMVPVTPPRGWQPGAPADARTEPTAVPVAAATAVAVAAPVVTPASDSSLAAPLAAAPQAAIPEAPAAGEPAPASPPQTDVPVAAPQAAGAWYETFWGRAALGGAIALLVAAIGLRAWKLLVSGDDATAAAPRADAATPSSPPLPPADSAADDASPQPPASTAAAAVLPWHERLCWPAARCRVSVQLGRILEQRGVSGASAGTERLWTEVLVPLEQALGLPLERAERVTWLAAEPAAWPDGGLVVIEIDRQDWDAAAWEDESAATEHEAAGLQWRQSPDGAWQQPVAWLDEATLVTGPQQVVETLIADGDAASNWRELLTDDADSEATIVFDAQALAAGEHATDAGLLLAGLQRALGPGAQAVRIDLVLTDTGAAAEVAIACATADDAQLLGPRIEAALAQVALWLAAAGGDATLDSTWADLVEPLTDAIAQRELRQDDAVVRLRLGYAADAGQAVAALFAVDELLQRQAPTPSELAADEPRSEEAIAGEDNGPPPVATGAAPPDVVARRLAWRAPQIACRDARLDKYARMLSRLSGLGVSLDPDALAFVGMAADAPVTVSLQRATVVEALAAAAPQAGLAVVVEGDQVVLTLAPDAAATLVEERYDVADLASGQDNTEQLAALLVACLAPGSWQRAGGPAACEVDEDALVVRQTANVQREIALVLDRLRVARGSSPRESAGRPTLTTRTEAAADLLARRVTATFAVETPLAEVVDYLSTLSGAAILLDGRALRRSGLGPELPVRWQVQDAPLGEALASLAEPRGLAWLALEGGALLITSAEDAAGRQQVELYPVGDLVDGNADGDQLTVRLSQVVAARWHGTDGGFIAWDAASRHLLVRHCQDVQRRVAAELHAWRSVPESP